MRDSDLCRSHQPGDPPNPTGGNAPDQTRHGGYTVRNLPDNPTLDNLIATLVDRLAAIDTYLAKRPVDALDLEALTLATDIVGRIGRLLRDKNRTSGADANTVAGLLSKAVDLLFDTSD